MERVIPIMLIYALTVFQKVLGLFLMASAGYVCGKLNIITEDGARQMTSILFYVVTPAVIVASLQGTIGQVTMGSILIAGVAAFAAMFISIAVGTSVFRKNSTERKKVLQFAVIYSNCGFMGLPLAQAVLGSKGVTYASVFNVVLNLIVWTHGLSMMRGGSKFELKRALFNPGMIGMILGLPLFAFSYHLPDVILSPIQNFSNLNTPLAMIVIGTYIARIRLGELFKSGKLYCLAALRLLLVPALCFAVLYPFHLDPCVFTTVLILAAAPSGANAVMFSAQFGGDVELASKAVALTTIFSLVTMPLFPVLANWACSLY
ncbi:MAG TPA: AEC family transporter [Caproicibacter sp.]|nr:AEC family transporter [Caproicibacter sp.]